MKRLLAVLFLFALISKSHAQEFKHSWDLQYLEHGLQFNSKKKAPLPFSTTGEPQATMIVGASNLSPSDETDIVKIIKDEIDGIRASLALDTYLEQDHVPNNNIVSYFENLGAAKLGIIKYRTVGGKNGKSIMPRSVKQIVFIHNQKLYVSTLMVLFAEDQDNMRSDQMTFVENILKK